MKGLEKQEKKNDYKIIIADLGVKPFRVIKFAFMLMAIIPLLVFLYIMVGKHFFYEVLKGDNLVIVLTSIFVSIIGFLYSYKLIVNMIMKLLAYFCEKKYAQDSKTELIISVSHDLKAPLTVVKSGISNILDGAIGPINKTQTEVAEICLRSINKLIVFINELLDVSKVDFVRTNLKRELVNLEEIVKNEINEISELARQNNQILKYKMSMKPIKIWADRGKISRVIMNILSNAIKYTPSGGQIEVAVSNDENTIKLSIANTGSGILPEELGKIFNKYERGKKQSGITGTGLGLSIAKDIVDLHRGILTAKSEQGKGIEFDVILPRDLRTNERK